MNFVVDGIRLMPYTDTRAFELGMVGIYLACPHNPSEAVAFFFHVARDDHMPYKRLSLRSEASGMSIYK